MRPDIAQVAGRQKRLGQRMGVLGMVDLYWTGGPARVKLHYGPSISEEEAHTAERLLDDFRSQINQPN